MTLFVMTFIHPSIYLCIFKWPEEEKWIEKKGWLFSLW
jgi:hypothetical protein